jgi:N-acetyl-beta-hexosaminidase
LREVANTPRSAWRTVHLDVPHRMYQTPKVVDPVDSTQNVS